MQLNGSWEEAGPGLLRRLVALGQQMMAVRVRFAAGATGSPHSHPHEQLTQVLSGRFRFRIGSEVFEVGAGESLLIPGGIEHEATALEAGELLDIFAPPRQDLLEPQSSHPE